MCKFLKKMLAIIKNIAYKSIEKLMNNARCFVFLNAFCWGVAKW